MFMYFGDNTFFRGGPHLKHVEKLTLVILTEVVDVHIK